MGLSLRPCMCEPTKRDFSLSTECATRTDFSLSHGFYKASNLVVSLIISYFCLIWEFNCYFIIALNQTITIRRIPMIGISIKNYPNVYFTCNRAVNGQTGSSGFYCEIRVWLYIRSVLYRRTVLILPSVQRYHKASPLIYTLYKYFCFLSCSDSKQLPIFPGIGVFVLIKRLSGAYMGWSWIYACSVKPRYQKMRNKEDGIDNAWGSVLYNGILCLEHVETVLENNHNSQTLVRLENNYYYISLEIGLFSKFRYSVQCYIHVTL